MNRYRLFGLVIESEITLPGLMAAPKGTTADVTIRRGRRETKADLIIPNVGSFWIAGGSEIMVEALPGVPERNVHLYLLGSAMGLVLHQRGLFPLHANAFVCNGQAMAVAGASGAGKSTLAAWLSRQGMTLVGDDVIALAPRDNGIVAVPGPPRVRLWREALERFGLGSDGLERSYVDQHFDKWDLPIASDSLADDVLPLGGIYVLEDAAAIEIAPLIGAEAVKALYDHTYRGGYLSRVDGATTHFRTVARIVAAVPIFRLARPRDLSRLEALGEALLSHARSQAARTVGAGRSAGQA